MAEKKILIKRTLTYKDFVGFIDYLKGENKTFELHSTGYTKTVITGNRKFTYLTTEGSKMVFPCYAKIKKDINATNIFVDEIPRRAIQYYDCLDYFKRPDSTDIIGCDVLNIDISSAYLTVLLNTGLITQETYDYVQAAPKLVRLKSVGMLATSKSIYRFENGTIINPDTPEIICNEEFRNIFFFCCYSIGEVMGKIAAAYGPDFLFFWVDGIYIRASASADKAESIMTEHGFKFKTVLLNNCNFEVRKSYVTFAYQEPEKEKFKTFSIPIQDRSLKSDLDRFIKDLLK